MTDAAKPVPHGEYACADVIDRKANGHKMTLACDRVLGHDHLHYARDGIGPLDDYAMYEWGDDHPGRRANR